MLPELTDRRLAAQRLAAQRAKPGRKLYPYQEVLLTLVYLRHNVSHAVVGQMFGVSADISENSFHVDYRKVSSRIPSVSRQVWNLSFNVAFTAYLPFWFSM